MSVHADSVAASGADLLAIVQDPLRPPDWRWRLTVRVPDAARLLDDKALRIAQRWRQQGCAELADRDLAAARRISLQAPDDPERAELEARVLAGQRTSAICARMMLSPRCFRAFRALWFDVGSRRSERSFMHQYVVGIERLREGRRLPIPWLWRAAGYVAGPRILEELLHANAQLSPDERALGVAGYLAPTALISKVLQSWIAECVLDQSPAAGQVLRGPLYEHARKALEPTHPTPRAEA